MNHYLVNDLKSLGKDISQNLLPLRSFNEVGKIVHMHKKMVEHVAYIALGKIVASMNSNVKLRKPHGGRGYKSRV